MRDEQITGSESIQIIQNMINTAKNQFSENGFLYLLWGWVVFVCSLGHFILMKVVKYEYHYMIWLLTWAAVIFQMFYLRKKSKEAKVKTYAEDIVKYVWITFVILMFLVGVLLAALLGKDYYKHIYPLFLVLYGMPTFLSGIILRFKPLVIGGIACWALSIAASQLLYDYQLLILALAVAIAWIIPGYLLQKKYKKENR